MSVIADLLLKLLNLSCQEERNLTAIDLYVMVVYSILLPWFVQSEVFMYFLYIWTLCCLLAGWHIQFGGYREGFSIN